jgi:flavin-dependent dehydrogenase
MATALSIFGLPGRARNFVAKTANDAVTKGGSTLDQQWREYHEKLALQAKLKAERKRKVEAQLQQEIRPIEIELFEAINDNDAERVLMLDDQIRRRIVKAWLTTL